MGVVPCKQVPEGGREATLVNGMSFLAGCCSSREPPTIRENMPSAERRGFKQPWIDAANPKERPSVKKASRSPGAAGEHVASPDRVAAAPGCESPGGGERKVGVGIVFNAGEEGKGPDGDGLVVNSLTRWAALSPPFQPTRRQKNVAWSLDIVRMSTR